MCELYAKSKYGKLTKFTNFQRSISKTPENWYLDIYDGHSRDDFINDGLLH